MSALRSMKRCVTLIELLVVIAILAMAAGAIGINIKRAVYEQRFLTEVGTVVDQLRTAQELMLLAKAEVKVDFHAHEEGIEMELICDEEIPKGWDQLLKKKILLRYIHEVHCEEGFPLQFFSRGSVMTKGIVRLEAAETRYIALAGYPAPIRATATRPTLTELDLNEIKELTLQETADAT